MKKRNMLLAIVVCFSFADLALAEAMPREGTFTDYYFKDRWGQGVFGIFFVAPSLHERLDQKTWSPITLTATDIRQPINPGSAMIQVVDAITPVRMPAVEIKLKLDDPSISFGSTTTMRVVIKNCTDSAVKLDRRRLRLRTTVHQRGTHPTNLVERDAIFDSGLKMVYKFGAERAVRAMGTQPVLTGAGDIKILRGSLKLTKRTDVAWHYYEQQPFIAPGDSREFIYEIGDGWLMNEYELQVSYQPNVEQLPQKVTSRPISFDVVAPKEE